MRKKQQVQTTGEALEKPESQIRVMWDTLKKNKAAVAGGHCVFPVFSCHGRLAGSL